MATSKTTSTPSAPQTDESATANAQAPEVASEKEIPILFIRTRRNIPSRRRAGFRFGRDGLGIALSALDDEQIQQLKDDPLLVVEEGTAPADNVSGDEAPGA